MAAPARIIYAGVDACDLHVAQEFAAQGHMPTLARLLETAAVVETEGPVGWLVGGNWPTILTGTTPSRHQFLCSGQIRGGTYEPRWVGPVMEPSPIWMRASAAGKRVAVLDAPHSGAPESMNGVFLSEWGCHDRHIGTAAYPTRFLDEVLGTYGEHPIGSWPGDFAHRAPCDWAHRAGPHRTTAENAALLRDLLDGHRRKARLSIDVLDRGGWDFFLTVFGETHCAGHQLWSLHDVNHPWHDRGQRRALSDDPLRAVYHAVDRSLGEILDRADRDTTTYVHLSHGMRAHFDGTLVLDAALWRLDCHASGHDERDGFARSAGVASHAVPRRLRRRSIAAMAGVSRGAMSRAPTDLGAEGMPRFIGQRRWWMQPNDSVYGSVRLNVEGREPSGRIKPQHARAAACWLADRLLELVNVDTAEPAVADVLLTDDGFERVPGDPFGDLIVEWNRSAPLDTVWSPATGVISVPYTQWRTGDHHRGGLLLATGAGIEPGRRAGRMRVVDVAPTLAAALDVDVPDFDGVAHDDLVPNHGRRSGLPARSALSEQTPERPWGARRWSSRFDVPEEVWLRRYVGGLAEAHNDTAVKTGVALDTAAALREQVALLRNRVSALERIAAIAEVSAWLRHIDVPERLLVSIVMPTRNRRERLERAIESVQQQSYAHWELLVVDDASVDDTWATISRLAASDARIRPYRFDVHVRSSSARNRALDHAKGDVIVYLDDDNRFDRDWLKAVVWAFTEYPDTEVCYGARVIDDDDRHRGLVTRSLPIIQFLPWDDDDVLRANRVDQNVIAHRPSLCRFDENIDHYSDWDLILELTEESRPRELPVVAAYYYSDLHQRLSQPSEERDAAERRVRERARARREAGR